MPRTPDKNLICGIDIGTSKVVALVAEIAEGGNLHVIGVGVQPIISIPTSGGHDAAMFQPTAESISNRISNYVSTQSSSVLRQRR